MNGDGRADIALAGYRYEPHGPDDSWVAILTHNAAASGTFTTTSNTPLGSNSRPRVALADIDGINGIDAVVALPFTVAPSVWILRQNVGGTLATPAVIEVGPDPVNLAAGDLNGDGAVDIVLANDRRPNGGIQVLLNDAGAPNGFSPPINIAFDRVVTAVAIGDVDGDGRADLAAAAYSNIQGNHGAGIVSMLYADPNAAGAFLPRVDFPAGAEPSSIRLADVDRDGRLDAVVSNARTYAGGGEAGLSVLLQNPNMPGAFLVPAFYSAAAVVADVAIADLNGDSWLDLAIATGPTSESLAVRLQDPSRPGVFLAPTHYAAGLFSSSISAGQLNSDSLPDVVVTVYDGVKIFFNNPASPGTFTAPITVNR
jgi:hypothetical protein